MAICYGVLIMVSDSGSSVSYFCPHSLNDFTYKLDGDTDLFAHMVGKFYFVDVLFFVEVGFLLRLVVFRDVYEIF